MSYEFTLTGPAGWLLAAILERGMRGNLARLKALLEPAPPA